MDSILVLDFGGQTTQLIARRIREIGIFSQVIPGDTSYADFGKMENGENIRGFIFSGSPESVCDAQAPALDPEFLNDGRPVLGICYGLQRIMHDMGGEVQKKDTREFGRNRIRYPVSNPHPGAHPQPSADPQPSAHPHPGADPLFAGVPENFVSWMSHGDSITRPAAGFSVIAESENSHPAALAHNSKPIYGLQFHPEVSHCEHGLDILRNFSVEICGCGREWSIRNFIQAAEDEIRKRAGAGAVLLLISGGVDSTVVGGLLLKCLKASQVHLMYIDTGLMRKNETQKVEGALRALGAKNLHIIHAEEDFLVPLEGVGDPEEKRRIIGDAFIRVQEREVNKLGIERALLAQGTLYTDMIESGKGVGHKAKVIKSHHNVRSPLVEKKRAAGLIIEPLATLYKDEVRSLGLELGIDPDVINRHPFPGPGLAVRILGEITREKLDILREADYLYMGELKRRGLYDKIWQAFAVLLPIRSVGVTGDHREYGYICALRAIVSQDGMTADVYPFDMSELLEISSILTNKVSQIGRVSYDISSKPPATIEWE